MCHLEKNCTYETYSHSLILLMWHLRIPFHSTDLHPFWLIKIHAVCLYCRFSHHMVPGPPGPHATGIPHPAIVNPQVKHEPPHETDIMHMWVLQTPNDFIRHTVFSVKLEPLMLPPQPLHQQFSEMTYFQVFVPSTTTVGHCWTNPLSEPCSHSLDVSR